MKAVLHLLIIVMAAAAGLAIGKAWRGRMTPPVQLQAASATSAERQSALGPIFPVRRAAPLAPDDSPLATQLAHDLSFSSGVTRWLYWMDALEKATPADFPRLARLAAGDSAATSLLAAKWSEANPKQMLDYIIAMTKSGGASSVSQLASVLMDEWPKHDLEGAIAAMNSTNDVSLRRQWRMQVASAAFDQDVERGITLFSEWNIDNYGPRMKAVAKWAEANPRHAAEFALDHPAGYASQLVIETVAKEWAKSDPAGALAYATAQHGNLAGILARTALKEWAGRDLNAAAEWLGAVNPVTRERLSPPFVEAWGKLDSAAALAWCESSLAGTSQANAVGALFKGAAARNVTAAADLVLGMNPSTARSAAAAAVADKWFPSYGSEKPVPSEVLAWVRRLDGDSARGVLEQVRWRWSETDPQGMAAFLSRLGSEQIPPDAYGSAARAMARKSPVETLDWAWELPRDSRASAATDAFSEWQRWQPDAARKWLVDLPAADPRRDVLFQTAIATLAHDPSGPEQLAALNGKDRAAAQRIIQQMPSLQDERRSKLLNALK